MRERSRRWRKGGRGSFLSLVPQSGERVASGHQGVYARLRRAMAASLVRGFWIIRESPSSASVADAPSAPSPRKARGEGREVSLLQDPDRAARQPLLNVVHHLRVIDFVALLADIAEVG